MKSEELLHAQRMLRNRLLDTRRAAMPGSSDLAAHLLLYLDDIERCWQLSLDWIRREIGADGVEGGFATPSAIYQPLAESVRNDASMASSVGMAFDTRDPSVRAVWSSPHAVVFHDVTQDGRMTAQMRKHVLSLNVRAKLALALRSRDAPVGLICCNWTNVQRHWKPDQCRQISELVNEVLSPIFATLFSLHQENITLPGRHGNGRNQPMQPGENTGILAELTPGELAVARLIVTGMSYKEIALYLGRSFSTVDHRLRAIREKLGARSTARMISTLSGLLVQRDGARSTSETPPAACESSQYLNSQ